MSIKKFSGKVRNMRRPNWDCVTFVTESEAFIIDFDVIAQAYPLFLTECL